MNENELTDKEIEELVADGLSRLLADEYAAILLDGMGDIGALRNPEVPDHIEHAWYKFYTFVKPEALKANWSRDRVMNEITAAGVPCYSGSCPEVYREKVMVDAGLAPEHETELLLSRLDV